MYAEYQVPGTISIVGMKRRKGPRLDRTGTLSQLHEKSASDTRLRSNDMEHRSLLDSNGRLVNMSHISYFVMIDLQCYYGC